MSKSAKSDAPPPAAKEARRAAKEARLAARTAWREARQAKKAGKPRAISGEGAPRFTYKNAVFFESPPAREPRDMPAEDQFIDRPTLKQILDNRADTTVISFPKSGRTWLGHMTVDYTGRLLGFHEEAKAKRSKSTIIWPEADEHYLRAFLKHSGEAVRAPLVQFLHLFTPTLLQAQRTFRVPRRARYILLLRDPRDVVVSHFHHLVAKNRRSVQSASETLPADFEVGEFAAHVQFGIRAVLNYTDCWAAWAAETGAAIFHYEDFVADTEATLARYLLACGFSAVEPALLRATIEETSFERMKAARVDLRRRRVGMAAEDDPRVRRGKVGGFRDEVDPYVSAYMTRMLEQADIPVLRRYLAAAPATVAL